MPECCQDVKATARDDSQPATQWYAAYTATHHEKRVHEQLCERGVESFLPLYRSRRNWKKRKPELVDLPLFPNYVFVHIPREKRAIVLGTPGVYAIVGSENRGWELPGQEIEILRSGMHDRKVEPHPYLKVGEIARVASGVLAGLEGIIVRKKNNLRIVLSLDQIMQSFAIEVDAAELEPIFRMGERVHQFDNYVSISA
ncbi:MAG: UpxY family transcription antiterminator [Acidobacteriota bacterium]